MSKAIAATLMFILIMVPILSAQETDVTGMFNVSAFGSLDIPTGFTRADAENGGFYRKMGFDFGVQGEYFFTPNIGAGLDFSYHSFSAKEIMGLEMEDKFSAIMLGAHAKFIYPLEGMIVPYAAVGVGMVMPSWKDVLSEIAPDPIEIDIGSGFYFSGSLGVMYFVTETVSIFAEAGGVYLFLKNAEATAEFEDESIEGDFGENLPFVPIKVGVNVWFGGTE